MANPDSLHKHLSTLEIQQESLIIILRKVSAGTPLEEDSVEVNSNKVNNNKNLKYDHF